MANKKNSHTPHGRSCRPRSRQEALKRLYDLLNFKDRVLITIDPDPDAIASAFALRRLLWRRVQSTTVGIIRPVKRLNNLTMVRLLKLPLVPIQEKSLGNYDKFLLVDGQPCHNDFFRKIPYTAVIDHHPLAACGEIPLADIRPDYGATSTILTEYLRAARIHPSQTLATALIYGIKTDTQNFERQSREEDVRAFHYLFGKANHNVLRKIEISDLALKDLNYFREALENKTVSRDRIYTHLPKVPSADILVILADFLLKVHDISWSIVSGVVGNTLVVIVRNDGYRKDAGKSIQKAFGAYGSAGGHKAAARAEIPLENLHEAVIRKTPLAYARFVRRRMST
ncbi:DHHA1 domain-containing protein [Desulfacinum hydrothermale DSM 13146]|uniref:DHHA1 domain-containing protein n=1 Tax=Desulfacinum hydrothermale DSM 13146 TaxID=1121390 RepID=A0A1W1XU09_9BACT|nr:DHH family phosphoesterase [Desulfacinum hydrothermale]SMC27377.1 DHHA1 domain-containing protein [Desulfacinum hydrothermale DSM 13146]